VVLRTSFTIVLLSALAASPAFAVEIIHQSAVVSARADGVTANESLPPNSPGTLSVEQGLAQADSEYGFATLSSNVTPPLIELTVQSNIHHWNQWGSGYAGISVDFVVTRDTGATIHASTSAQGGSGNLGGVAHVRFLDADGWIWQYDPSSTGQVCHVSHPRSATLCRVTATLPPGEYSLEVTASAYFPPDCGPCHGYAIGATVSALMIFTQGAAAPIQLTVERDQLTWTESEDAEAYDVLRGSLDLLRVSRGDFTVSTKYCLDDDRPFNWLPYAVDPLVGTGSWFLVRAAGSNWGGSYDTLQPSQILSRNAPISAAPSSCP